MGIPVGIDVTRYVAAEEEGKTAQEAREDAAIIPDAANEPETEEVAPPVTIDLSNTDYNSNYGNNTDSNNSGVVIAE